MELFNETILMWLLFTMIFFTLWIDDPLKKVIAGYVANGLIIFHFIFSVFSMSFSSSKLLIRRAKLCRFKIQHSEQRRVLKRRLDQSRDSRKARMLAIRRSKEPDLNLSKHSVLNKLSQSMHSDVQSIGDADQLLVTNPLNKIHLNPHEPGSPII